eukprot:gb/GECH01014868.1/.p1 GENE.gb/GECH01014868.1/~~gb/GECH01014868.1/.p1  ORF type:complete len:722 (+),score=128.54 gb/GECH01014868.1/:1-2166(+)
MGKQPIEHNEPIAKRASNRARRLRQNQSTEIVVSSPKNHESNDDPVPPKPAKTKRSKHVNIACVNTTEKKIKWKTQYWDLYGFQEKLIGMQYTPEFSIVVNVIKSLLHAPSNLAQSIDEIYEAYFPQRRRRKLEPEEVKTKEDFVTVLEECGFRVSADHKWVRTAPTKNGPSISATKTIIEHVLRIASPSGRSTYNLPSTGTRSGASKGGEEELLCLYTSSRGERHSKVLWDLYEDQVEYTRQHFPRFRPAKHLSVAYVEGIDTVVYIGRCGRVSDTTPDLKYAVVCGYHTSLPVMVLQSRLDFTYEKVERLGQQVVCVTWSTGEKTLEPPENFTGSIDENDESTETPFWETAHLLEHSERRQERELKRQLKESWNSKYWRASRQIPKPVSFSTAEDQLIEQFIPEERRRMQGRTGYVLECAVASVMGREPHEVLRKLYFPRHPGKPVMFERDGDDVGFRIDDISQGKTYKPVSCVNEIDNEPFPEFQFTTMLIPGPGVDPAWDSADRATGCSCNECDDPSTCFICRRMGSRYAYDLKGRVTLTDSVPIFECNDQCPCSDDCRNRVVQKGTQLRLEVFKTRDKGWGLRTNELVPRGTFVGEYNGELISDDEAERRGLRYDEKGCSYLFDVGVEDESKFCIDSYRYGDSMRFANHSCQSNLETRPVFINNQDLRISRIAYFASRDIKEGEELTFDYKYEAVSNKEYRILCRCGAPNCRRYLL